MEEKERLKIYKEKIEFYQQEKIKIHVTLKDSSFLNGLVEKKIQEGVYLFIDDEIPEGVRLFLKEIYKLREWREFRG